MKKILLLALAFVMMYNVNAQIQTPQPSPFSKVEQKVGLTDVTLEYSRPAMRGRKIFGNLVPFGAIWRTGANARTKINFSTDVTIDGQTLKAGSYAIFTKPEANSWEVYFYTEHQGNGAPQELDESKVAAKTTVAANQIPITIQSYTMSIDDITNTTANIGIIWENTYVGIPFEVPTDKAVMASIDRAMSGSPSENDFYAAAVYYLENEKDITKAKTWIDKAVSLTNAEPRFWFLRQQSLIYAKAGDKKGAIAAAKKSLQYAETAGNADYIKLNKDSIAEWIK